MSESENETKKDLKLDLGDVLKKVVSTGIGAFFLTEDALKTALSDVSVSKEMVQGLLSNAKGVKDDFLKQIKSEMRGYLSKVDLTKEIGKILENYDLDVQAKIKFNKIKKDSDSKSS